MTHTTCKILHCGEPLRPDNILGLCRRCTLPVVRMIEEIGQRADAPKVPYLGYFGGSNGRVVNGKNHP